jgi:hypothetical protein
MYKKNLIYMNLKNKYMFSFKYMYYYFFFFQINTSSKIILEKLKFVVI